MNHKMQITQQSSEYDLMTNCWVLKTSISGTNTNSQTFTLFAQVWASLMTVCSGPCYMSIIHCF